LKNQKAKYHEEKAKTQREIVKIYHENNGTPGYRMMADYLALKGIFYSYSTIYAYMDELGIKSITRRKRPNYSKGNAHKVFPDLLNQMFNVESPNQVWATDFTYMILPGGSTVYNCSIIDLYKRNVVATLNGSHIDNKLAIATLKIALERHKPKRGIILHSDQGSQFTSKDFVDFCKKNHIQQSMSRVGCPYDNAPMERFINTLKTEFFNLYTFSSIEILNEKTYEFVYVKYNNLRPHQYNGGLPPNVALRVA